MISRTRFTGIVHGKTIVLQDDAGLSDGEQVTVTIEPISLGSPSNNMLERLSAAARLQSVSGWLTASKRFQNVENGIASDARSVVRSWVHELPVGHRHLLSFAVALT